ncbi:hypothetical protein GGX14DRAFT_649621 [Mycena pura]|uniref:Uncharacterized protein n=1 Tax=Mycena pura TaxID=153505 RepID=A0AAD6YN04_9AGAR|nr:hypothetical protein GGX14DRAFT_649621 [Mycena pura]
MLSSAASLDLSHYAFDDSLLSESLTLSSLSSATSSTPPIPAGCMVPLSTIIGHHEDVSLRKVSKATLTSPTPPRLRTMLKEKLLIETWLSGIDSDASNHTPWGGIGNAELVDWKSEGSIYSPQAFKAKLAFARRRKAPRATQTDSAPAISVKRVPDTCQRSINRNALVFEREIILNSGSKSSRVSLQAATNSMDPDVVAMISELQSLNSFFKKQEEVTSDLPPPPSLIVSNSHFSLPVSLESSGKLVIEAPLPLAARRGMKMLPPVPTKQLPEENQYPSMPTAFLGSPSTYSPKFEFASDPNRSSMDLQQMLTSLRASIDCGNPLNAVVEDATFTTEDDEWAFADGLLDTSSPRCDSDAVKKPLLAGLTDYAEESLTDNSSSQQRRESLNPNAPPSTPLPPCPAIQSGRIRSILKSSKSVRFASLPNDRPDSIEIPETPVRRSLRSSSPPKKQPVPRRPKSHTVRSALHDPLRSPPPKLAPTRVRPPNQRRATTPAAFCHLTSPPASGPCTASTASPPKKSATGGRHSLGRVFASSNVAKENKGSSSNQQPAPASKLDENVLSRASIAGTPIQKSRMPVPLRNILTRFK